MEELTDGEAKRLPLTDADELDLPDGVIEADTLAVPQALDDCDAQPEGD